MIVALRITDRVVDGVSVLDLDGKIVLGDESNALREKVKSLLESGTKNILLNFERVSYLDSTGLGTLVGAFTSAESHSAKLKLTNLSQKPRDLMQITKLLTVFEVFTSEKEALASFGK